MAGSIRWFDYFDDAGNKYGIRADESNIEALHSGPLTLTAVTSVPREIKIRRATFQHVSIPARQKTIPILTVEDYGLLLVANPAEDYEVGEAGDIYRLVRLTPERRLRKPYNIDTGLNDGDQP